MKNQEIAAQLRASIVSGKYQPGDRVPTRRELETQFSASPVTVQRALAALTADGFLAANRRGGTRVVDAPPHLNRYALVIGTARHHWGRFYRHTVERAAALEAQQPNCRFPVYAGVGDENSADLARLIDDVTHHRVAGLIMVHPLYTGRGQALLANSSVPRVLIGSPLQHVDIPVVDLDHTAMAEEAVNHLHASGCRRVGALMHSQGRRDVQLFMSLARQRGLKAEPQWCQICPHEPAASAQHAAQLLASLPRAQRPDGIFIDDDNLVTAATSGLLATGSDVVRSLTVVAHANFPKKPQSAMPVRWIGFSLDELLQTTVDTIARQRQKQSVASHRSLSPMFEDAE